MNQLKAQSFLEADPSCSGRGDEAKIPYEENTIVKDGLGRDAVQFSRKRIGNRMSKISCQGHGADSGAIVELYPVRFAGRAKLPLSLQISD